MKNALKLLIVLSILPLAACSTASEWVTPPSSVTVTDNMPDACVPYATMTRIGDRCFPTTFNQTYYSNGTKDRYVTTIPPGQSYGSAALNSVGQALTAHQPLDVYVGEMPTPGYYGGSGYYGGYGYGSSRNPGQALQNRNSGYGYGGGYYNSYSGPSSSRNVGQAARTRDAGYGR